jgi:hypothetical protein
MKLGLFAGSVREGGLAQAGLRCGRQRSWVWRVDSSTNEYRLCYCEDPFGNLIEVYTHNYEALYGGMKVGESDAK